MKNLGCVSYMRIGRKIAAAILLFLMFFSFSGCSIRRAENETGNELLKTKQGEIKDADSDDDGLLDSEEKRLGTDKNNSDTDQDGLNDFEEVRKWKTDPINPDSDDDGYKDGEEIRNGYNPSGPGQLDSDSDGLGDADEKKIGTDPDKFDTDGDGLSDKEEIEMERDPLIAG